MKMICSWLLVLEVEHNIKGIRGQGVFSSHMERKIEIALANSSAAEAIADAVGHEVSLRLANEEDHE